jgi:hypothetical protein
MGGNATPVPGMSAGQAPDTAFTMVHANAKPAPPPGKPDWDIAFTRLTRAMQPRIEACALDLAHRFQAIGLGSDMQARQTPRGLSTFLALVGQRGLVCIVDMTLLDGRAVGLGTCAALDARLLDGCGDVVAEGLASGLQGRRFEETSAALILTPENLERSATAVYVAALAHFDLLRPMIARHA